MKVLKTILQSRLFYLLLLSLTLTYSINYYAKTHKSKFDVNDNSLSGVIVDMKISNKTLTLNIKSSEEVVCFYYFKNEEEIQSFKKEFHFGDKVLLIGSFSFPNNNTFPNLFNYREYLKRKKIYLIFNIDSYEKVSGNTNIIYRVKNNIINYIEHFKNSNYLYAFILGNTDYIDLEIINIYQDNGISHLFAISGMHIGLFTSILIFIFNKLRFNKYVSYIIISLFLIFYMILIGSSISVNRAVLFFIFLNLNKLLKFNIKTICIWIITFCILVISNPYCIFEIGFQYSFIISLFLILYAKNYDSNSYIKKLFHISLLSFLASLPITLYNFYSINLLSVVFNIFFVPFISLIVFPLGLLTFICPFFEFIFGISISVLENISIFCHDLNCFSLLFGKPNILLICIYYLFLIIMLTFRDKKFIVVLILILFIQYYYLNIFSKNFLIMFDVGQGDSTLFHLGNKTILIDTGGSYMDNSKSIAKLKIIPFIKSSGIRKIDYLILSHGDYDHMGEAVNLVNNFKVDKVIFNCGEYNNLEKKLIEVLEKKKINYYSCIKKLNIDKYRLQFLNTGLYDNENDNSSVIYLNYNNYKFLFMGDASTEREKDILEKYNLKNMDFIKVGHHGSNTSSSKEFINIINPKYSLISVGKNNRYGHPKESVIEALSNSKIYRTDLDGSIEIKLNKSGYKIKTCPP